MKYYCVVDIGNTDMEFAFFEDETSKGSFRIGTKQNGTTDELTSRFLSLLQYHHLELPKKILVLISSVVPSVNRILEKMFVREFDANVHFLSGEMLEGVKWGVDTRLMGSDRLINVYASTLLYPQPFVVVDLGTATTFDVLIDSAYRGGLILPGVVSSLDALINSAERLSAIRLSLPTSLLGSNTEEHVNNGVYYLHKEGIIGTLKRIHKEIIQGGALSVIFTGGISNFMHFETERFKDEGIKVYHNPTLATDGLVKVLRAIAK